MLRNHLSPGQRLLVVYALTIFGPGLLLAIFGARALWQEKQSAGRQLQSQLDHGADVTVRALADQLSKFQSMVDQGLPPERAFRELPPDGSWAFVEGESPNIVVYPLNILPYELGATPAAVLDDPELKRAEELEMQVSDPALAAQRYRDLLSRATSDRVPQIKHGLARSLRRAHQEAEATQLWREIAASGGRIGALPADLVAGFELAAVNDDAARAFYRHLDDGVWRIEKPRYLYYLLAIRERLGAREDIPGRVQLAQAVEGAPAASSRLLGSGGSAYLILRRQEGPFAALVVSAEFLRTRVWPRAFATLEAEIGVSRIAANGQTLYASSHAPTTMNARRTLDESGLSWTVEVEPADAAGFFAARNRTTNLYAAMLAVVVMLLGSGGYFIARTVQRELEVARLKSDFVATVSHEFRSPLTGIRQLAEMLVRDRVASDDKRHQYYELIVREADRLTRLVENALDFSRMEEGRKEYRFERLDTAAWLGCIAEEFQLEAKRTGHILDTDIPEQLPAVEGDREALSTALRNLLDNACKYSPASTTVGLDVAAVNGGVCIRVKDQGVGIPAGEQQQIFEKFYRGRGELAKQVKGAGLGLSLVQHIVSAHQGQVTVESTDGQGSTFSVHLKGIS
jgi:signal transduction histidine kinase